MTAQIQNDETAPVLRVLAAFVLTTAIGMGIVVGFDHVIDPLECVVGNPVPSSGCESSWQLA